MKGSLRPPGHTVELRADRAGGTGNGGPGGPPSMGTSVRGGSGQFTATTWKNMRPLTVAVWLVAPAVDTPASQPL